MQPNSCLAAVEPTGTRENLFSSPRLGGLSSPNRLVVAPVARVAAADGWRAASPTVAHYRAFYGSGFGPVPTESIHAERAYAQSCRKQPRSAMAVQAEVWRVAVGEVRGAGGQVAARLIHPGALARQRERL